MFNGKREIVLAVMFVIAVLAIALFVAGTSLDLGQLFVSSFMLGGVVMSSRDKRSLDNWIQEPICFSQEEPEDAWQCSNCNTIWTDEALQAVLWDDEVEFYKESAHGDFCPECVEQYFGFTP